MESRLAYLGIGLKPEIWRYCRHITDEEAVLIYTLPKKEVAGLLGVSREVAGGIQQKLKGIDLKAAPVQLKRLDINFVTKADDNYPPALRQIYDPPATVFVQGTLDDHVLAVAIVGARRCTGYGRAIAEEMAMGLAKAGITVVSGMARGIDSAAHNGALQAGKTIAVMGCGLDVVYPPENRELAERIKRTGAVISEFPPGTPPRPINFPARNRLISGLSSAVVIVEASKRSGALITADFALEQGKEVLVVPGSVRSPVSAGCHDLLKQGAGMAVCADDVLEAIGYEVGLKSPAENPSGRSKLENAAKNAGCKADERRGEGAYVRLRDRAEAEDNAADGVFGSASKADVRTAEGAPVPAILKLVDFDKTHVDEILARAERPPHEVLSDLSLLEINGLICRQAGGWYIRLK